MVAGNVAAVLKRVDSHAELGAEFLSITPADGHAVESHAVGVLASRLSAAHREEVRLEILHEVEALALARRVEDGVGVGQPVAMTICASSIPSSTFATLPWKS